MRRISNNANTYHITDVTAPEIWLKTVVNDGTLEDGKYTNWITFRDLVVYVGSVRSKVRWI